MDMNNRVEMDMGLAVFFMEMSFLAERRKQTKSLVR